jgi:hypothetical protein
MSNLRCKAKQTPPRQGNERAPQREYPLIKIRIIQPWLYRCEAELNLSLELLH